MTEDPAGGISGFGIRQDSVNPPDASSETQTYETNNGRAQNLYDQRAVN